jgi:hypothetical protein
LPRAKGGSHFKVCWAGKLVIGGNVTGFLIIAAVGAASGLIQISSARPSRPLRAQRRDLRHRSAVCAGPQQSVCCKLFVMERSESNFLFRAYVFVNASAASEAIIVRRLGNLAMGSV